MIEIIVKAPAGEGKSTIASYIATVLYNIGIEVIINDSDEIKYEYAAKERLQHIINNDTIVAVTCEQTSRIRDMDDVDQYPIDFSDTSSKEYVSWMASVWKLNDERNKELAQKDKIDGN